MLEKLDSQQQGNRIIVTVIGQDKVGIIAKVATILAEHSINILDISQTILQEFFAMVLVADMEKSNLSFENLKEKLNNLGQELGLKIDAQHEDVYRYMHRI
ncbi:ACT domain-containing protein [Desulfotomaculum sp. 1211_IL3151]|uniref:ACT domain-containing protein n=1 Tax=Desulfotomaculum sp. 1211_IL3151 TaxID=3084055 RepID=UPI002FDA4F67